MAMMTWLERLFCCVYIRYNILLRGQGGRGIRQGEGREEEGREGGYLGHPKDADITDLAFLPDNTYWESGLKQTSTGLLLENACP